MTADNSPDIRLRLGTRRSPLAMVQAEEARSRLCAAHGLSEEAVELVPVIASGDRIQDRPLAEIGGKALWTRELDIWLAEGKIDAAVHSMKDVETIRPASLAIAAILPRADKADRLLGAASLAEIPPGATIGTSAPRRAAQLLHHRPGCKVVSLRGNVATRMAKLASGEVDATFLAAAGLSRLGEEGVGTALDIEEWLPAPAQGAIGLECRADDRETRALLAAIDHAPSHAELTAERALLRGLGGTCHSPIAAVSLPQADGGWLMKASLFSPDGSLRVDGECLYGVDEMTAVDTLAADLLERAPATIAVHFGHHHDSADE
ncbi:hydroxymethylbilane synthase [Qipengyuania atrilutea]|uniref:Porphobilinogen deaminase n=1 Tax=Qipengyuania atrilutea TaxID=2744473 RepID=A0A850H0U4_9SPHN|nr:hydroxymethylbilane synthase [Actirhodobacter atriluteus]NVD43558.1 hydroxymethylbilane synthase [Actirhodobacter atriluteus]